jgi:hypothetical protein
VPGAILQKEVGAPQGYNEFLEAIADPKHERQKKLREWSGKDSICCISTDINHALPQFSPRKSTPRKSAESAITGWPPGLTRGLHRLRRVPTPYHP